MALVIWKVTFKGLSTNISSWIKQIPRFGYFHILFHLVHFLSKRIWITAFFFTYNVAHFFIQCNCFFNNLCSLPGEEIKLLQVTQQLAQTQLFKRRIYLSTRMTYHYLHHENLPERLKRKHCDSFGLLFKSGLKSFYNKIKTVTLQLSKHLYNFMWSLTIHCIVNGLKTY